MDDQLMIRPMRRDELDLIIDWAADEGWNPGLGDAEIFWATDPEGFVAAEVVGSLVGGGSIISYGGRFGFMGFFIVRPEWRGRGLGGRLWHARRCALLARLEPGSTIGMDGVPTMQAFYRRGGFESVGRDVRLEGVGASWPGAAAALVDAREVPFAQLATYDAERFAVRRDTFLARWIDQPGSRALAAFAGGVLHGYGVVRRCRSGCKIGPLFATDAETAEVIFRGLSDHATGERLFLDVPERNAAALALAARHGMREVFDCSRMYLGLPPNVPVDEIFGITTFELG